ncbi:MAG: GldG family protein [Defluviitaleaceae bacterium]|nr:GldG family protein [Defluviitaleaceae bacterium]
MLSVHQQIIHEPGAGGSRRGYIFAAVFLMTITALMVVVNIIGASADFHTTVGMMGAVLPVFAAWITAGLPQPLSMFTSGRLFSKYLADNALFAAVVLLGTAIAVVPAVYTDLNLAHLAGAYAGLLLLGVSYLSLGLCLRLAVSNTPVLGVVSFVLYGCLYITVFEARFHSFVKGLPSLGGVVFFVSFSVFFAAAALITMQERRQAGKMPRLILTALAAVLMNVGAARVPLYADLTRGQIFTLSAATADVLDALETPVHIYANFPPGYAGRYFDISRELLLAYGRHPNVHVSFAPSRRLREFGTPEAGSIVVIGGGAGLHGHGESSKVIPPERLFAAGFDEDELRIYVSAINLEAEVTNAVLYCVSCGNPRLAHVAGGGSGLPQSFAEALVSANYMVDSLDLRGGEIAPDVSVVLITAPAPEWGEAEAAELAGFLDAGGGLVVAVDDVEGRSAQLAAKLHGLGIEQGGRLVAETRDYLHTSHNILADARPVSRHGSTRRVLVPNSRAVFLREEADGRANVQSLITTSPYAFERPHPWEDGRAEHGTFALGARIETTRGNPDAGRVVVLGGSGILDAAANELSGGENYRFLIEAIDWTQGIEHAFGIPPTQLHTPALTMTFAQSAIAVIFPGLLLPGILLSFSLGRV